MVEMEVIGVAAEPNTDRPLVWLKGREQTIFLPIVIGKFEAGAIYMQLVNEPPPRPITYDLLRAILEGLDVKVSKVSITALKDSTFYAEISLEKGGSVMELDSRPSDAIALALRTGSPIYASEEVLNQAGYSPSQEEAESVEGVEELPIPDISLGSEEESNEEQERQTGEPKKTEQKMETLKAQLKQAVLREAYEEAAQIRDEINRLRQ